jgi:hypothetical protein
VRTLLLVCSSPHFVSYASAPNFRRRRHCRTGSSSSISHLPPPLDSISSSPAPQGRRELTQLLLNVDQCRSVELHRALPPPSTCTSSSFVIRRPPQVLLPLRLAPLRHAASAALHLSGQDGAASTSSSPSASPRPPSPPLRTKHRGEPARDRSELLPFLLHISLSSMPLAEFAFAPARSRRGWPWCRRASLLRQQAAQPCVPWFALISLLTS